MKCLSFLASTMLIVLISQHSIMALPINATTEQPCAAGLERINDQCVPIRATTNMNELESSSFSTVTMMMPTENAVTRTLPRMNACPPGTERAQNGRCESIAVATSTEVLPESSSFSTVTMVIPEATTVVVSGKSEKMEACPEGFVRGQNGQCQPVELSTSTEALLESSSLATEAMATSEKMRPAGKMLPTEEMATSETMLTTEEMATSERMRPAGKMLPTEEIATSETMLTTEEMATSERMRPAGKMLPTEEMATSETMLPTEEMATSETMLTTEEMLTTEVNSIAGSTEAGQVDECPAGSVRGRNGECKPIELMTTTQVDDVETTSEAKEMSGKPINLLRCPEGTKRDDDGSCQEIVPSKQDKTVDPKEFLEKDGSCPKNFKKGNGECLYVESETNATAVPGTLNNLERIQPKSGVDQSSNLNQLVRADENDVCPTGTQHYENGLCMVVNQPLTPNVNSRVTCGDAYELVNGRCIRKNFRPIEVSTDSMTAVTEQVNTEEKADAPRKSGDVTEETMTSGNEVNDDNTKQN